MRRLLEPIHRPRPLVVRVANCASVSTGPKRAADTFRRALTTPGKFGLPDVVLCQEVADVDCRHVAWTTGLTGVPWQAMQRKPIGSPESGLAIAIRKDRIDLLSNRLLAGTPGTHEGGGIRRRPVLLAHLGVDSHRGHGWSFRAASGHAAPARAPRDRSRYLDVFRALRIRVRGGDLNVLHRIAARLFARRVYSIGVLHLVVSRWIPARGPHPVDHGSDHPGVDVLLWPAK